jgi:hypothetical protein
MNQGKIIKPEDIFQKFSDRLKEKKDELQYIVYFYKQFEKWLQYELVLAMRKDAIPVIYNSKFMEIKDKRENICDIATEYPVEGYILTDVVIAESPFAINYADNKNWQVLNSKHIETCKKCFRETKNHYIELKQVNWVDMNYPKHIENVIMSDLTKYADLDGRTFNSYNPKSIISICCITFWDKGNESGVSKGKAKDTLEKIYKSIHDEFMSSYKKECFCLTPESVTEEIYLFGVYFNK